MHRDDEVSRPRGVLLHDDRWPRLPSGDGRLLHHGRGWRDLEVWRHGRLRPRTDVLLRRVGEGLGVLDRMPSARPRAVQWPRPFVPEREGLHGHCPHRLSRLPV